MLNWQMLRDKAALINGSLHAIRSLNSEDVTSSFSARVEFSKVQSLKLRSGDGAAVAALRPSSVTLRSGKGAPVAKLKPSSASLSGSEYTFQVVYKAPGQLKRTTLDKRDIWVTGSNGFSQSADVKTVRLRKQRTVAKVTYSLVAPDGLWDASENGTYTVKLRQKQVSDQRGTFAKAKILGQFEINLLDTGSPSPDPSVINPIPPDPFTPNPTPSPIPDPSPSPSPDPITPSPSPDPTPSPVFSGFSSTFTGSSGDQIFSGGEGLDGVDYSPLSHGITVNLATGKVLKPIYGGLPNPKIMPLGDSITDGLNQYPGAYRVQLFSNFVNDGFTIDFVGSKSNGSVNLLDQNHEGYPGATIKIDPTDRRNNIFERVTGTLGKSVLSQNPPDVILLMIGTNDTDYVRNGDRPVEQMISNMSDLIDEITTRQPEAHLIISTIAPVDEESRNLKTQQYNASLQPLVDAKAATGLKVTLVNAGGRLTLSDLRPDNVHPTNAGHALLGNYWYEAIADRDQLTSIEGIVGTDFTDTMVGDVNRNIFIGGTGSDQFTGGGGSDVFVYQSPIEGTDTLLDFTSDDIFQVSASGFGGGLQAGMSLSLTTASTGVLVNGNMALSADPTFLYSAGTLFFDKDGTGAAGAVAIATLANGPESLSVDQFSISG